MQNATIASPGEVLMSLLAAEDKFLQAFEGLRKLGGWGSDPFSEAQFDTVVLTSDFIWLRRAHFMEEVLGLRKMELICLGSANLQGWLGPNHLRPPQEVVERLALLIEPISSIVAEHGEGAARDWVETPQAALEGLDPQLYLETPLGPRREVLQEAANEWMRIRGA